MYTLCYKTVSVVAATEFKPCELWLGIGAHLRRIGGRCSRQDEGPVERCSCYAYEAPATVWRQLGRGRLGRGCGNTAAWAPKKTIATGIFLENKKEKVMVVLVG